MRPYLLGAILAAIFAADAQAGEKKDTSKPLLSVEDKLTDADPLDAVLRKSFHKVHKIKLEAGKTYRFDLTSEDFDTFLRLEDDQGKRLGQDDDGGDNFNSRMVHTVPEGQGGEYRLIVTTYKPASVGSYRLVAIPAGARDVLLGKLGRFQLLDGEQQAQVLTDYRKYLAEKAKDLTVADVRPTMMVASQLEFRGKLKEAIAFCRDAAEAVKKAADPKLATLAPLLDGMARRLDLPGNPIDIKGKLLDGKEIDWAAYKGKVVLVDFWATWCGPCRAEFPNMIKMHEAYNKRGFEIVGISLDRGIDAPKQYMEKEKLPWVSLHEGGADLAKHYGVFSIPQAILVGRDGKVVSLRARGNELNRLLEEMIGPAEEKK